MRVAARGRWGVLLAVLAMGAGAVAVAQAAVPASASASASAPRVLPGDAGRRLAGAPGGPSSTVSDVSCSAPASAPASAAVRAALRVGDWRLGAAALAFLDRVARVKQPEASAATVAAAALEDRVVGEYALATVGDDALFDNRFVALTPEASAEASLYASIETAWHAELAAAFARDGGLGRVVRRHPLTPERLRALLGAGAQVRLDDRLPAAHEAALGEVVLLEWRMDGADADAGRERVGTRRARGVNRGVDRGVDHGVGDRAGGADARGAAGAREAHGDLGGCEPHDGTDTHSVDTGRATLADVWRRLTLQERTALYNGDAAYAMHQADELARRAAVRQWVSAHAGIGAADFDALLALVADHDRRIAFMRWSGAVAEDHYHSAELERLRQAVSDDDVRRWYDAHPDAFRRTERVRARHVHCDDEARCDDAGAALKRGEPFDAVARRFSRAGDAAAGGELGWIDAARARQDWLAQLAFALPPGPAAGPLRTPGADGADGGWEIVQVLERVQGRHPADSEAVRFGAGRAIAHEQAVAHYGELRARLLAQADVELDPAQLGFGREALAAAEAAR